MTTDNLYCALKFAILTFPVNDISFGVTENFRVLLLIQQKTMSANTTLENSTATDGDIEDEDDIITLQEAIQSEQALIADANAVLGACDAKNCTYSQVCVCCNKV